MSELTTAFNNAKRADFTALGAGLPTEALKTRFERSLNLVAARKVIDRLDAVQYKGQTRDDIHPETSRRVAVSVPRHRWAEAVVPAGFEGLDTPERTFSLHECRMRSYRPYPFGMHGVWPLVKTHLVTLREDEADSSLHKSTSDDDITVTHSSRIGFYESTNTLNELVTFSRNLELIARAGGFYEDLTLRYEELFLPENYASLRAH